VDRGLSGHLSRSKNDFQHAGSVAELAKYAKEANPEKGLASFFITKNSLIFINLMQFLDIIAVCDVQ
jgi:hypothetical protein